MLCTQICIDLSTTDSTRLRSDPRGLPLWGEIHLILLFYPNTQYTMNTKATQHGSDLRRYLTGD